MARHGRLAITSKAVAEVLEAQAESLSLEWRDRAARRDLGEQILALYEHSASCLGEADGELTQGTGLLLGQISRRGGARMVRAPPRLIPLADAPRIWSGIVVGTREYGQLLPSLV